jgi:hypothetical protein
MKASGVPLFAADGLVSAAASPHAGDVPSDQLIKQLDDALKGCAEVYSPRCRDGINFVRPLCVTRHRSNAHRHGSPGPP